jgi:hypothetical protein
MRHESRRSRSWLIFDVGRRNAKMPLVISRKAKRTFYVESEEMLGEILGHDNFDREDWAVGDSIVFEDGTGATLVKHQKFHVWSEPKPIELRDVVASIRSLGDVRLPAEGTIESYSKLFEILSVPLPTKAWWRTLFIQ